MSLWDHEQKQVGEQGRVPQQQGEEEEERRRREGETKVRLTSG